jgi:hypothetical protein
MTFGYINPYINKPKKKIMSNIFAIAIPILPGKTAAWKKWQHELTTTYYKDFVKSRKKMNVRERSFLQHTPMGDIVLVTLEGDNPQKAFTQLGQGNDEFTKWFNEGVKQCHGIDLTQPPTGALPELIADTNVNTKMAMNN